MRTSMIVRTLLIGLAVAAACAGAGDGDLVGPIGPPSTDADSVIAITNVTAVTMETPQALAGQTLLVRNGRIAALGPTASVSVPQHARVIDGRGGYIMPGLIDSHVHLSREDLPAYVASGITSVRNMWGWPGVLTMQHEIDEGTLLGPAVFTLSSGIDGTPPVWPFTQIVTDPAAADDVVAAQQAQGYTILKLYRALTPAVYDAVVASARARGLRYGGHVPLAVSLDHAIDSGHEFIEHFLGYDVALSTNGARNWSSIHRDRIPALVAKTVAAGVWNCPTMEIYDRQFVNSEGSRNRRFLLKALHDGGARLLVGTDAGIDLTAPGISIHQELEEFVLAGLSPYNALRGATTSGAEFLGLTGEIGVLRVGARGCAAAGAESARRRRRRQPSARRHAARALAAARVTLSARAGRA